MTSTRARGFTSRESSRGDTEPVVYPVVTCPIQVSLLWSLLAVFQAEPTPGTVAFFGYGTGLEQNPAVYGTRDFERSTDGFFVKLAYQFRR